MAETEQSKRLQASLVTSKGTISETTAISQGAINNALGKLLENYPDIGQVHANHPDIGSLEATAEQPLISLKVTGASREDAEYFCKFSKGTLQFLIGDIKDPINVSGWTIAFDVKIGYVDIEENSDEDKEVRSKIQQPGDFSLTSLFLTFNDSKIISFNKDNSDFNGFDMSEDTMPLLGIILARWYTGSESVMADRKKRTIAYGLKTAKPQSVNEEAPSFPPTALTFQTYEYIAPGKNTPDEGLGTGDSNMLLYLQMTDHQDFPPQQSILPYSGNFVSSGMHASTCIGHGIFWESYLLRHSPSMLLKTLNVYTYAYVANGDVSNIVVPRWEIGFGSPSHSSDKDFFSWVPVGPLEWKYAPSHSEQFYDETGNGDGGWDKLKISCNVNNTMKSSPGSNKIEIGGKTDINIYGESNGTIWPGNWTYMYTMHIWIDWNLTVSLDAVEEGGLEISLNLPDDLTEAFRVNHDDLQFHGDTAGTSNLEGVKGTYSNLQEKFLNQVKNIPFKATVEALQKDLQNSARFVVPGGGTFMYKNPIFNNDGDLLIEADYKI